MFLIATDGIICWQMEVENGNWIPRCLTLPERRTTRHVSTSPGTLLYSETKPSSPNPWLWEASQNVLQWNKYKNAIVVPWYCRPRTVKYFKFLRAIFLQNCWYVFQAYCVDSIEANMSPMTRFHDGNFGSYRDFYKEYYKTDIHDPTQPLLKCKIAGVVGKHPESSWTTC